MPSADTASAVGSSEAAAGPTPKPGRRRIVGSGYLGDFRMAAFLTGLTAFTWYGVGALPLQLDVARQLGLNAAETSSWVFIVWFSGAVASIVLGLWRRLPVPITWTIPGLIYLGTLSGQFTFAEIVGANLLAGIAIVVLGVLGVGKRIMAWLPLPIVMGMFAGSILVYVTRMVSAAVEDVVIAGVTLAGYLAGRFIASPRVPPMGLAIATGGAAVWLSASMPAPSVAWTQPALVLVAPAFSLQACLAVSLPMAVLAMGLGNVQGLGFLVSQGYRVPVTMVTVVTGVCSVINAFFGGHAATVGRAGAAIVASSEAGPAHGRYWASVIAATLSVSIAIGAGTLTSLFSILPRTFVVTLAALAILSSLQEALAKAFGGKLRFGGLAAFAVAATPFAVFGITSAFWAILAGLGASLAAERKELMAYWRGED